MRDLLELEISAALGYSSRILGLGQSLNATGQWRNRWSNVSGSSWHKGHMGSVTIFQRYWFCVVIIPPVSVLSQVLLVRMQAIKELFSIGKIWFEDFSAAFSGKHVCCNLLIVECKNALLQVFDINRKQVQ